MPSRSTNPRLASRVAGQLLLLALLCPLATAAADRRQEACGDAPKPAYAPLGAVNVAAWRHGDPVTGIRSPDCADWPYWGSSLVVVLTGRLHAAGGADMLLARFGAISSFRGVRYWSVSDQRWRTLISDASALSGPDAAKRRVDFSIAEVTSGKDLYFTQADNRSSGQVVYRMRLSQAGPDRIVATVENVSGIWLFILRLFAPGDLHSLYVLEKLSPGVWGYYSLSGMREGATALLGSDRASLINRANAIYRHIADMPTDAEPPAAP
jgi:hypothetical protein